MTRTDTGRRYELDWLRTLAFALLILYHIGMYYVADWGWHIKSEQTFKGLQELMILTNPWRMSLLFLLAGMALSLVLPRISRLKLLGLRSKRLLIPLLFTMFVVVVPQVYYEALSQQLIQPGYLEFWWQYVSPVTGLLPDHHSPIGLLTWNHAWFIPYLWCYSLLVLLCYPLLNLVSQSSLLQQLPGRYALALVFGLMFWAWWMLKADFPSTHALVDDWYNHAKYFLVFIAGFLLARQDLWWQQLVAGRRLWLVLALCCYCLIVAERNDVFVVSAQFDTSVWVKTLFGAVLIANHWLWLLAVLGYGGAYLAKTNSPLLRYCNDAVLPWYILHQTLIIVCAAWLKPLAMPVAIEFPLVLAGTVAGCWLGYEVIRRSAVLSWCFGIKPPVRRFVCQVETQTL
ncbi:MAG: acyltransferase family protein [Gammaproteobacteria bacterium]|nr:acyltransferase family protein [Gammaproteobacteria bacterium]MBU2058205.1 acyltransferase family protein [Gammaproteobacteria bacterium]MBU2176964.1 acyltransferase family protein [Gammaproteobacteria bacterium]MBU2246577.1 acyltransferase family protein [Gammaproteobacteria bacterium]MBU2344962.1 acyltransferase family protein [Gammaproteobacteria bacterium]